MTREEDSFSIVVEGWRSVAQSLSIVNQFQCLELLKRSDLRLFHVDAPQPPRGFLRVGSWPRAQNLHEPDDERALARIPAPPANTRIDATYRIAFPYDFSRSARGRTFVFAVAEGKRLNAYMIAGGQELKDCLPDEVTIVTPSNHSRARLIASGAAPKKVKLVPHGADLRFFRPTTEESRQRLRGSQGWAKEDFVFLHVGALYEWKGTPVLLKAFAAVAARHPHVRLILKGIDAVYASRASVTDAIKGLAPDDRAQVANRISYYGQTLSYEDLARLYQCADVLVSPYSLEGFNMPVLEAIACGLPVICTQGGPTDDFAREPFAWRITSQWISVKGGASERLMPDLDHLIHLMDSTVKDREFRARAAATGPAFVEANYSWGRVTQRLIEVLKSED
jgi:glycosyltransferase involved in cell wall biosynthesis